MSVPLENHAKDVVRLLKDQNRILEALNKNLVSLVEVLKFDRAVIYQTNLQAFKEAAEEGLSHAETSPSGDVQGR